MRLFWKLFCSMVLLTAMACSIGGFVLIDTQFRTALDREVEAAYGENDLLRSTLARELGREYLSGPDDLWDLVEDIFQAIGQDTAYRVTNSSGTTFQGFPLEDDGLAAGLAAGSRGWKLVTTETGAVYLCMACPFLVLEDTLYLETYREVTPLFTLRAEQYRSFFYLMLVLIAAAGGLSFVIASVTLRPLDRLSKATRRMAAGELDQRVKVTGNDELSRLSADFNSMAAQLEAQVLNLKDAARRQEDFVGSFAHEIKTPLTSIIGYADLLLSRPAAEAQVQESASYIFSEGRRLEALSRKLMDLIVLDKQDFPLQETEMAGFLDHIGSALRPALMQAGIRLRVRAAEAKIPLEPDLMETVYMNLIDNARKAIDGPGLILLEGSATPGGYCIRVTDNGKGIPQDELSRITEAFYMVDKSRARAQGGAGLGLALCQRIVALHGGEMGFRSVEGTGTQVSVYLKGGGAP